MLESGRNWELFGYDMRNLGRHWVSAWRDFLWSYDSPVRRRLDEPVLLRGVDGEQTYHAGEPCSPQETDCCAVQLPDELVLLRRMKLPVAVEADLDAVLALEVGARSPFGTEDTASGWRVAGRDEQTLDVLLAIVSKSAVMTYIAQHYGSHDAHAQEVWVSIEGKVVVIEGFGEERRAGLYRKRLLHVSLLCGLACLLLLITLAMAAGFKKLELGQVEEMAARVQSEAAVASRHRSTLGQANETIAVIKELSALYPSPHPELARLTRLLKDDAYLERFTMNGLEIDLRGRADNAAVMMQELSEQPEYVEVTAVSPIRRIPNTEVEQFHLKVRLEGES